MRAPSRTSRETGDPALITAAAVLAAFAFLCWIFWITWHTQIAAFIMKALLLQLRVLPATPDLAQLAHQLQAAGRHPQSIRAIQLFYGLSIVGLVLRWPVLILCLAGAAYCFFRAENRELRTVLDLEGLIGVQARMFPTLRGFAKRRLTTLVAPEPGARPLPADPALTPEEWRACYATGKDGAFSEIGAITAFRQQLGQHYTTNGPLDAPPVSQILFAAFVLHKMKQRDRAMKMLGDLSSALENVGLDGERGPRTALPVPQGVLDEARGILKADDIQRSIQESCNGHGWSTTALMSLLCDARFEAGVLAPPAFAIVKLLDRPLWYALHSLGFPSENPQEDVHPNPRIEAAGARSHWSEERRVQRPLYVPALERALATIRPPAS